MKDGVKLAADVHLPEDLAAADKVPALLYQTRYWRSYRSRAAGYNIDQALASEFSGNGSQSHRLEIIVKRKGGHFFKFPQDEDPCEGIDKGNFSVFAK